MSSKVLNTVADSIFLRLGAHTRPTDWFKAIAQEWREFKRDYKFGDEPLVTEIPGIGSFTVKPVGHPFYEFVLINPELADIRVMNPDRWSGKKAYETGPIYVAFRSRFMQHEGLAAVKEFVEKVKDVFMVPYRVDEFVRISRMDLAVDLQMPRFFELNDLDDFVTRARFRDVHMEVIDPLEKMFAGEPPTSNNKGGCKYMDGQNVVIPRAVWDKAKGGFEILKAGIGPDSSLTRVCHTGAPQTFYFGRFGSDLYARIYDKTAEIKRSGKVYMNDYWKASGWDGKSAVVRVEFSLTGDALKTMARYLPEVKTEDGEFLTVADLRDFDIAVASIPNIWQFLTHDWLRHCDRGEDSNRSRWATSELWRVVQGAWPVSIPVIRVKPPGNSVLEQLKAQMKGIFLRMTVESHPKGSSADTGDQLLAEFMEWKWSEDFQERLDDKRRRLGRDEQSDAWFSADVRRQIMLEGFGS